MSGKSTAAEIENYWTYRDILTCILFMDFESVAQWKAQQSAEPDTEIKL